MVKNYQKIMDDEYVNAVLKNIQMRVKLQNLKAEPMNEYDNGIEPRQTMEQTLNRTEFLNNTMAQRQKMDENLFKLFQDDEVSINIVYDNIAQSDEDVLFFNSNFNKLYKELSNIIDLDYLDSNYFIAFYERYKQKYSDPKNIIVDENLMKLDEEEYKQGLQDVEKFDQIIDSTAQEEKLSDYNDVIDFFKTKPTYKKFGVYMGAMAKALLVQERYYLSGDLDILNNQLIDVKKANENLGKIFSKLKLFVKHRYNVDKLFKYGGEIRNYFEVDIFSYDNTTNEGEALIKFLQFVVKTVRDIIDSIKNREVEIYNAAYQKAIDVELEQERQALEAMSAKQRQDYLNEMARQENLRIQAEQVEQARLAQAEQVEQARLAQEQAQQAKEESAAQKMQNAAKLLKAKKEAKELLKQKKEEERIRLEQEQQRLEEERIRLEQEEDEEFNETQYIQGNPHGFNNGDIITDNSFSYEVVDNYAKKLLKNNLKSETGKLEYTTIKGNLGWYKGGKAVNVSIVQAASITPTPTAIKSKYPFDVDIPEAGESFRRYGDYLFRIDPTNNNKLKEYPKYKIESDDRLTQLSTKNTPLIIQKGHDEHKQDIQDYNATLGAGLKRNIGVSKILKSLGYEII